MKMTVIGCGRIGGGIARRMAGEHRVFLYNRSDEKARGLAREIGGTALPTLKEAADAADVVFLAFKPQELKGAEKELRKVLGKGKLVLSALAGTSIALLKECLPEAGIIRIMLDLAMTHGEAAVALCAEGGIDEKQYTEVKAALSLLGDVQELPEKLIDPFSAITGSGPAFMLAIVESVVQSSIALGFSSQQGLKMALQLFKGVTARLENEDKRPEELKWEVASPAGSTIYGLNALEENGVRSGIIKTFLAAHRRTQDLQ